MYLTFYDNKSTSKCDYHFPVEKSGTENFACSFSVQGRLTARMLINFVALQMSLFFYKILVVLHYLVFIPGFAITIIL